MLESPRSTIGGVTATILLAIAACPLRDTLVQLVTNELLQLNGVVEVQVHLKAMTPEQRQAPELKLRGAGDPV